MSGIYIPGMEMPKSCFLCYFSYMRGERLFCNLTKEEVLRAKIASECPLISVPDHGRLIDADALPNYDKPIGKMMMFGGEYVYTQTAIDNAPTIIPADKGGADDV